MRAAYKEYSSMMSYEEYLNLHTKSCVDNIRTLIDMDGGMNDQIYNMVCRLLNNIKVNSEELVETLQAIKE